MIVSNRWIKIIGPQESFFLRAILFGRAITHFKAASMHPSFDKTASRRYDTGKKVLTEWITEDKKGGTLVIDFSNLGQYRENNRIEAKRALGGLPESIWETYSAFANTLGGIILLGVEEYRDGSLHPIALPDPEWLVETFWEAVNDPKKASVNILSEQNIRIEDVDGKSIVVITVPRAQRSDKPVYIDGSPMTGTYRRNGEGD